jgi:hypothetical protein
MLLAEGFARSADQNDNATRNQESKEPKTMEDTTRKKRVLCPVTTKDGKTYWMRMGSAFVNRDNSINIYLDGLPTNGKLQLRDWDDPPWEKDKKEASPQPALGALSLVGEAQAEQLPF